MVRTTSRQYRTATNEQDTLQNVTTDNSAQEHGTTAFTADDSAILSQPVGIKTGGFDILSTKDYSDLSLHSLLSQPVPIAQGVMAPGGFGPLVFGSHENVLTASPFHLEKVRGYMGIRATVVIRLVVNADKYTQGRYSLAFLPINTEYIPFRSDHRSVTQLTSVELDLNTDTEVILRIPHRGPYTHFDILNKRYNTGVFIVTPILAHRGNNASFTIYQAFEDIDLIGPTTITTASYESGFAIEEKPKVPLSEKVKNIGSALMGAAGAPLLGPYITACAWATAVAGNVMSAFGYSKPITTETPSVYVRRTVAKLNHSDGTDYAEPMAMTTTTGVRVTENIGLTDQDEMSFAYLLGLRSQIFRFNYGITAPSGTKLLSFPLDPYAMKATSQFTGIEDAPDAMYMHPMAYIANIFAYYRGSIEVTLDVSKTIFHSGRLMVVFEPTNADLVFDQADPRPQSRVTTIENAINCHKDIVDIRSGNTFSFVFPFTALTPYLPVGVPYGYVHIFVLNSLVRNDTSVSDIIDVGVKVKACDDMEFAAPGDPMYWPTIYNGTEANATVTRPETLEYESGLETNNTEIVCKPIGTSSQPVATTKMAELCIGEKILSMKQLAMRGKIIYSDRGVLAQRQDPFVVDQFYSESVTNQPSRVTCDFYSYAGALFCYGRGGVILTILNLKFNAPLTLSITTVPYALSGAQSKYGEFTTQAIIAGQGTERVYVPPYDTSFVRYNHARPGNLTTAAGERTIWDSLGYSKTKFFVSATDGDQEGGYNMWRSAAEDTQFGGFSGVPLMYPREPFASFGSTYNIPKTLSYSFSNS